MASTLTSSSTLAQIQASYVDNASYAEDSSPTKAAAFVTACRILLLKLPAEAQQSGRMRARLDENLRQIKAEMDVAKTWLASNTSVNRHIHANLNDYRT